MKKIFIIFSLFILTLFTTCCTTTAQVYADNGQYIEAYYDDAIYAGYNIVYVEDWPYWFANGIFIPYHHNHILRYKPHCHQIIIAKHKPRLYNNRYYHPSWRRNPPSLPRYNRIDAHNNTWHQHSQSSRHIRKTSVHRNDNRRCSR